MSVKLSAWVWDGCAASGVKGTKLLVMARLADFSSDEGICWPSVETIARQIGAGRSSVITAITQLAKEGWLTRTERRQGQRNATNIYTLNAKKLKAAADSFDGFKSERSDSEGSSPERSESGEKPGSHGSESGHDPSLKPDPSVNKNTSPEIDNSEPGENSRPETAISDGGKWGSSEDLECAQWMFSRIKRLYERAAESDGEISLPKEPNWAAWANDVRLMRTIDRHSHRQICELFKRVQEDGFWCRNILSPGKLREKWGDLLIRLASVNLAEQTGVMRSSFDDEYYKNQDPAAFRGFRVAN
ncbi:helix-turn-helix domain-containing protein [Klebsiella aerogenes]